MTRHVLVLGDVGAGDVLHVGDEAMLETAMAELSARQDLTWTVVSGDPAESSKRYGVPAIGRFGFGSLTTLREREARLEAVVSAARGESHLPAGDPAQALVDAVSGADAVLIAGGGNLASAWPEHLYERAALALVAAMRQTPLVVSGQSLGPQLTGRDGELLSATLTGAQLVGVRERASAALARRLGVLEDRLWCAVDDAWSLADEPAVEVLTALGVGDFAAVCFSDTTGIEPLADLVEPLALLLDAVVESTGLDVVLVPHQGSVYGGSTHDVAFHEAIAGRCKSTRVHAAPLLGPGQVAWLTRQASLVVSSRYHAVVFGLAAATPVVGVAVDDYTQNKIRGALELTGLEGWCVSVLGLRAGFLATAIDEAWQRRVEVTTQLAATGVRLASGKSAYWDAVACVIAAQQIPLRPTDVADVDLPRHGAPVGDWTLRNEDALTWSRLFAQRQGNLRRAADLALEQVERATRELDDERRARRLAVDESIAMQEALAVERAAGEAARWNNAEVLEESFARFEQNAVELGRVRRQVEEYDRLQQTKLLRWTKPARSAYSSWRRRALRA